MSAYAWSPSAALIASSGQSEFLKAEGLHSFEEMEARARQDPGWLWDAVIRFGDLKFYQPYAKIMDDSRGKPWTQWCVGGKTNLVLNCLDRYRQSDTYQKTFIFEERENGDKKTLTYAQFDAEVCKFAGGLLDLDIKQGDVVALYMPNVAETYIAYYGIAKIGAIVMPLFSGFGPRACADRLRPANAKAVVTVTHAWRRGKKIPMKKLLEEVRRDLPDLKSLIYVDTSGETRGETRGDACEETRDIAGNNKDKNNSIEWGELLSRGDENTATVPMDAMAPAVIHYTSGTTGSPKGCVYTHIGLVTKMLFDHGILTDFRSRDRHFCMADMGWMVGSKSATIAAVNGGSMILAEGLPDYPQHGRFWRLIQDYRASWVELSPALIRNMMRYPAAEPDKYDLSSLRIIVSGGEPWTETAWNRLFDLCGGRVPILNSAGGTEVSGSILLCDLHHPLKRGGFSIAIPGMGAEIRHSDGSPVATGEIGELVMAHSSVGLTAGLWENPKGYLENYWNKIPSYWAHGDLVSRDEDGFWFIHGRSDDVIKISGKRVGPAEIENSMMHSGRVLECAAVGLPDEHTGNMILCLYVPKDTEGQEDVSAAELEDLLIRRITKDLGRSFCPKYILQVADLPKTRTMKIMRKIIRSALMGEEIKDVSSVVNPAAVRSLQKEYLFQRLSAKTH